MDLDLDFTGGWVRNEPKALTLVSGFRELITKQERPHHWESPAALLTWQCGGPEIPPGPPAVHAWVELVKVLL